LVEAHSARHEIAAALHWAQLDAVLVRERFEHFDLDQRQLSTAARRWGLGVMADPVGIAIALETAAGGRRGLLERRHRLACRGCDENPFDVATQDATSRPRLLNRRPFRAAFESREEGCRGVRGEQAGVECR